MKEGRGGDGGAGPLYLHLPGWTGLHDQSPGQGRPQGGRPPHEGGAGAVRVGGLPPPGRVLLQQDLRHDGWGPSG